MEYSFQTSLGNLSFNISKELGKTLQANLKSAGIETETNDWFVISMLYKNKSAAQNEIAETLGLNKVKITRLIEKLEQRNLIERDVLQADKRHKNVRLTDSGNALYHKIEPLAKQTLEKALAGFSQNEYIQLVAFCNRILNNLKP